MKKVLLAIDGLRPAGNLFTYTLQFCHKMRADLIILQIVNPASCRNFLRGFKTRLDKTQQVIEDNLTAATMAEAGEEGLAREYLEVGRRNIAEHYPTDESADVACRLEQIIGDPEQEMYTYLEAHPEIVMTIFDSDKNNEQKRGVGKHRLRLLERIPSELGIPLIMSQASER